MDRAGLIARLGGAADRMAALTRNKAVQGWSDFDLTLPQLRALGILARAPSRMGDLAAVLGSSLPATTSLVERLEGKGLAERAPDPTDRRAVVCRLTDQGRALADRFWQLQRLRLEAVAEVLTTDELVQVVAAVELLAAAMERHERAADAPPAP